MDIFFCFSMKHGCYCHDVKQKKNEHLSATYLSLYWGIILGGAGVIILVLEAGLKMRLFLQEIQLWMMAISSLAFQRLPRGGSEDFPKQRLLQLWKELENHMRPDPASSRNNLTSLHSVAVYVQMAPQIYSCIYDSCGNSTGSSSTHFCFFYTPHTASFL
jgi:hypothetical protein